MNGQLSDILKKVRRLEIVSNRSANDLFAGEYKSVFRGQGIEFSEVREYQPGDDIRLIDWNVTARAGRPFIKRFVEERERIYAVARALSRKFTDDEAYIEAEVARSGPGTCVFCLIPEHMTGKLVNES